MSSGRSSQEVACCSVDRTKYLMLSKSILDKSAPQSGRGFLSKSLRDLRRSLVIHSDSFFLAEMSRTTSSLRPRRADAPASSESAHPYSYVPSPSSSGCATEVMRGLLLDSVVLMVLRSFARRAVGAGGRGIVFASTGQAASWGDVCGTHTVAVGDGGQAAHRGTQKPSEGLDLGLTELRELGGHVRDGTVVLAKLFTASRSGRAARGGGVAVAGKSFGQQMDPVLWWDRVQQGLSVLPARRPDCERTLRLPRDLRSPPGNGGHWRPGRRRRGRRCPALPR